MKDMLKIMASGITMPKTLILTSLQSKRNYAFIFQLMGELIVLKNVNFRGFIMADSLIGLFIISLAIGLFYFN